MQSPEPSLHTVRYAGKNLLFLLLAIGAPAALLYLRLVFGYVVSEGELQHGRTQWLSWASNAALALFVLALPLSAAYVQRLLKQRTTLPAIVLQYVAVLLLCGLLSLSGAVLLEAFGYNFFLRARLAHQR